MRTISTKEFRCIGFVLFLFSIQYYSIAQIADLEIDNASQIGINIESSGSNGIQIVNAGVDGVQVQSAGRDGLRVSSAQGWGVNVTGTLGAAAFSGDVVVTGKLGFNTLTPGKLIDVNAGSAVSGTEGLRVLHSSGWGGALLANNSNLGGWFVTDGGSNYAPLWANSFNILSDRRVKRNLRPIKKFDYKKYVSYYENLETTAYNYQHEPEDKSPHIGIIAQSAPAELQSEITGGPLSSEDDLLSINLADWMGLNTVVIKYLLEENEELKSKIQSLAANLAAELK